MSLPTLRPDKKCQTKVLINKWRFIQQNKRLKSKLLKDFFVVWVTSRLPILNNGGFRIDSWSRSEKGGHIQYSPEKVPCWGGQITWPDHSLQSDIRPSHYYQPRASHSDNNKLPLLSPTPPVSELNNWGDGLLHWRRSQHSDLCISAISWLIGVSVTGCGGKVIQ